MKRERAQRMSRGKGPRRGLGRTYNWDWRAKVLGIRVGKDPRALRRVGLVIETYKGPVHRGADVA
jgi:hypothetical protein